MATLLDDRLVAGAMDNLDEWTGDARRISRTVRLDEVDALLAAVQETADALDHHPEVARDGNKVTFVLWTHSAGGVTELDIALASRIDDFVLAAQHLERDATGQVHSVDDDATQPGPTQGRTVTAAPNLPTPGQTTPARPAESATGDPYPTGAEGPVAANAPTMNEPAAPRQDAGMIVAPDAEPGSIEPQPGNAPAPGMHERTDAPE
jgi:4a-hydroxytetrahydrobiopterin dehydratase